jgi:Protein of unknown function (DUF4435)
MKLLDKLRGARDMTSTFKFRLLLDYAPTGKTLHCFFEGRDDESFYVNFIHGTCPQGWRMHYYRCGSKSRVCDVWRNAMQYDQNRLLFFVDKDHDDFVGPRDVAESASNVFVTDYYSIENYLVDQVILRRFLRDIIHLDLSGVEEDAIANVFNEQRDIFYRHSLWISAWIICARRYGIPAHVANVEMDDLFEVATDMTLRRRAVGRDAYLRSKCSVATGCTWREVLHVARQLRNLAPKTHIRGKFDLWFLVAFLHRLPGLLAMLYGATVHRVRTPVTRNNAVEILGPRLPVPPSLQQFLIDRLTRLA